MWRINCFRFHLFRINWFVQSSLRLQVRNVELVNRPKGKTCRRKTRASTTSPAVRSIIDLYTTDHHQNATPIPPLLHKRLVSSSCEARRTSSRSRSRNRWRSGTIHQRHRDLHASQCWQPVSPCISHTVTTAPFPNTTSDHFTDQPRTFF